MIFLGGLGDLHKQLHSRTDFELFLEQFWSDIGWTFSFFFTHVVERDTFLTPNSISIYSKIFTNTTSPSN